MPTPWNRLPAFLAVVTGSLIFATCLEVGSFGQAQDTETAAEEQRARDAVRSFELSVRPLFETHCVSCHGPDKSEGGLRLDRREHFLAGGDSGSLIGDSLEESLLIQAIRREGLEMPPSHPLPQEAIDTLVDWVRNGATWPAYEAIADQRSVTSSTFREEDLAYWLFQPHRVTAPPLEKAPHPIDAFVEERLSAMDLHLAEPAEPRTLARRLYLDLLGMPPTWQEMQTYLSDESPDRYERLVARLLDDPRYGERWARYWLDLVRFAESDGFKQDAFRSTAYRYRDYVIDSFNENKRYPEFVIEQLAGDELEDDAEEENAATGYLRHWMYEYNQRDVQGQWENILNDLTDVTGEVFLGVGFACARCHDHKFDPILQVDYYRLQAYFAAIEPRFDIPVSKKEHAAWMESREQWLQCASPVRERMQSLESEMRKTVIEGTIDKFPPEVRPGLRKPRSQQSPEERPLSLLAFLQIENDLAGFDPAKKLSGEQLSEWKRVKAQWDDLKRAEPSPPVYAMTVRDSGAVPPETRMVGKPDRGPIAPGSPTILERLEEGGVPVALPDPPVAVSESTGRRLALARWISHPRNPMTWRTIVNRVWQHHFGRGLVESASDLGRLSGGPSHPELLDWLAHRFVEGGGDFKALHALIVTSATYRQSAYPQQRATGMARDPENRWLWRYSPHRMDADQLWDSILLASGELDPRAGGPSDATASHRRSIYQRVMRNTPRPMFAAFDGPDGNASVAKRNLTTTPLQALWMMNSEWPMERSEALAKRLLSHGEGVDGTIDRTYRGVLLREPSEQERHQAAAFLRGAAGGEAHAIPLSAWTDLCHALLSSNEFLYVE